MTVKEALERRIRELRKRDTRLRADHDALVAQIAQLEEALLTLSASDEATIATLARAEGGANG